MSATNVNDQTFQSEVIESSKPVLIDFWAPWCGPCRMMGPVVDELAEEMKSKAVVVKINIDEAPETAARFGIQSIPTFAVFQDGEVKQKLNGVVTKAKLQEALEA